MEKRHQGYTDRRGADVSADLGQTGKGCRTPYTERDRKRNINEKAPGGDRLQQRIVALGVTASQPPHTPLCLVEPQEERHNATYGST